MPANLFANHSGDVLVLGLGKSGIRIAQLGAENALDEGGALWGAAHDHAAELIATGLEHKLTLKLDLGPFAQKQATRELEHHRERLERLASGRSTAILVGAAPDDFFRTYCAPFCDFLSACGLHTIVVARDGFAFEHGNDTAYSAPADLSISLRAETLAGTTASDAPLKQFLAASDHRWLAAVEALVGALTSGQTGPRFTAASLKPFARGPIAAGLGLGQGQSALKDALTSALNSVAEVPPQDAFAVAVVTGHDLTAAEAETVSTQLCESLGAPKALAFSTQAHMANEAVCLILAHATAAKRNVVSIAEAVR